MYQLKICQFEPALEMSVGTIYSDNFPLSFVHENFFKWHIVCIVHCYMRISWNGTLYPILYYLREFLPLAHCILCLLFTRIYIPGTMYAFRGCKDDLQTSVFGCWASLFALCCYWQVLKDNEKEKGAFIAYYSPLYEREECIYSTLYYTDELLIPQGCC